MGKNGMMTTTMLMMMMLVMMMLMMMMTMAKTLFLRTRGNSSSPKRARTRPQAAISTTAEYWELAPPPRSVGN